MTLEGTPGALRASSLRSTLKAPGVPSSVTNRFPDAGGLNPGFEHACIVTADMRQLAKTLKPRCGLDSTYVRAKYEIGLTFGDTELKAFIQWEENVCAPKLGI